MSFARLTSTKEFIAFGLLKIGEFFPVFGEGLY